MSIYQVCQPDLENAETVKMLLQTELNISKITAGLLVNRGITSVKEARAYLHPALDQLNDPFDLSGMDRAVKRVRSAVASGEKITIYGDYDADGITSSSMLSLYLKSLGAHVDVYIPSRQEEGYGLHREALRRLGDGGTGLLLTVDCGITAAEEIREGSPDMDIIVTDHHMPGAALPDAFAVIDPKIPGQAYPYRELAGVGVASKLVQALGGREAVVPFLDLIALGTVADVVPLTGENRALAALGICQIREKPRPGIAALLQELEMEPSSVNSGKISFTIAPCLNAPGRMTTYRAGYELLTASRPDQALPVAEELVGCNRDRRETEQRILESVQEILPDQVNLADDRFLVVAGEGWHPGVIGIVASRISERYHRPSVVLSLDGEQGVGSARSVPGFDLYRALSSCRDLFSRFGGHEQAAGLSILTGDIPEFRRRICEYAEKVLDDETLIPHYVYDGQIAPEDISPGLLDEMEGLAPFGVGNPTPRFLISSAVVENSRLIGRNANHIKLDLALGQRSWDAVGFGMAEAGRDLQRGCRVSLLTSLKRNEWRGVSSTQLQICSLKRIYRDHRDLDNLLASFHFKFFDVFFNDFLYNGYDVPQARDDTGPNNYEILTVDQATDLLDDSAIGTGIFVSTLESAVCILESLLKKDMLDRIPVRYHSSDPADGAGRNSVILIPGHRFRPERFYHTVLLPAVERNFHGIGFGTGISPDKIRYLIVPDAAGEAVSLKEILRRSFTLTRRDLGVIYKWLRRITPGRDCWPDSEQMLHSLREGSGRNFNGFQMQLALEIFKELNFISVETGSQTIRIRCFRDPIGRQLKESRLYVFHRQWLLDYGIKD